MTARRRMPVRALVAACAIVLGAASGCGSTKGKADPAAERRAYAQVTKDTAVADLDAAQPGMRARLDAAPGWAVFSTIGARVFVGEAPGGFGVAHDTKTGAETYMRMTEPSYGEGLGSERFRAVFVFRDEKTFREFVDKGWDFRTDAAGSQIDVFQLTDAGLATEPTLAGTRFWRDKGLN
jgi:hypothetical protein